MDKVKITNITSIVNYGHITLNVSCSHCFFASSNNPIPINYEEMENKKHNMSKSFNSSKDAENFLIELRDAIDCYNLHRAELYQSFDNTIKNKVKILFDCEFKTE